MSSGQLIVENLSVGFGAGAQHCNVVQDISFTLQPGKITAIIGESGSGKSVTARSLVGLAGPNAQITAQRFSYAGRDLLSHTPRRWRQLRGKEIGFILQDALISLDPLRKVGQEITEALRAHGWGNRRERHQRMLELLARVGCPDPELRAQQRPDQLSGGLRQRALIATALALDPAIVIADEPTTALDATVQAQILHVFRQIRESGKAILIISHDLGVVSHLADEVIIMQTGRAVEQGNAAEVMRTPRNAYTRALLDAVPITHPRGTRLSHEEAETPAGTPSEAGAILLQATDLSKSFDGPDGVRRIAVDQVSLTLRAGQTLGIVGESGSGKTTIARLLLGLETPDVGGVIFDAAPWNGAATAAVVEKTRRGRRRDLNVIYQDPLSSFDPRWNVGQILSDNLDVLHLSLPEKQRRIGELLTLVRLDSSIAQRHPLQLSGGQRQRVAIARAIASNPKLIVCDEPVSALDALIQAQILDLLANLQKQLNVAYVFISHDLGVIRHVSDFVLVMKDGKIVERGSTEDIFHNPQHPFTQELLAAAL